MMPTPIPIDRLPDVVLGRDPEFARPQAFAALAASDLPDREQLLATVLEGADERPEIRAAAAVALGRIATAASERALLANLNEQMPAVLAQSARSLGHIGSARALAHLRKLTRSANPRVAEAAQFGTALIAHRFGLPGYELPMPLEPQLIPPPTPPAWRAIDFKPMPSEQRPQILEGLRRYPFGGIEYDTDSITGISCGGAELVLALNREITAASDRLFQRKALAGVVALRSPETDEYSVWLVVLTAPAAGAVNVELTTSSGPARARWRGKAGGRFGRVHTAFDRTPGGTFDTPQRGIGSRTSGDDTSRFGDGAHASALSAAHAAGRGVGIASGAARLRPSSLARSPKVSHSSIQ